MFTTCRQRFLHHTGISSTITNIKAHHRIELACYVLVPSWMLALCCAKLQSNRGLDSRGVEHARMCTQPAIWPGTETKRDDGPPAASLRQPRHCVHAGLGDHGAHIWRHASSTLRLHQQNGACLPWTLCTSSHVSTGGIV